MKGQQRADFGRRIIGMLEHVFRSVDAFVEDILRDGNSRLLFEQRGQIARVESRRLREVLHPDGLVEMAADIFDRCGDVNGIDAVFFRRSALLRKIFEHLGLHSLDVVDTPAAVRLLDIQIAGVVGCLSVDTAFNRKAGREGRRRDKQILEVAQRIVRQCSELRRREHPDAFGDRAHVARLQIFVLEHFLIVIVMAEIILAVQKGENGHPFFIYCSFHHTPDSFYAIILSNF